MARGATQGVHNGIPATLAAIKDPAEKGTTRRFCRPDHPLMTGSVCRRTIKSPRNGEQSGRTSEEEWVMIADIIRYIKIKRLSQGRGHPEFVPVRGSTAYPQSSDKSGSDGTGEFDSASRGGPAPG